MNKTIWIVLIIVVIVVVIYFINKNNKPTEIQNPVQNLISNSGLGNVISSGSGSGNTNTNTNTTPAPIKTSGFEFGDDIYAKDSLVNTYKTASTSGGNLASYKGYTKGQFIGTYLGKEGGFVKVLISSPASSVFVISTQVYSK